MRKERGEETEDDNGPELRYDLWWAWEAFCVLARQRSASTDPNPISLSDVNAYVKLAGISCLEDRDFLLKVILELDDVWLNHHHEVKEKNRQAKDKKGSPKPKRGRSNGR